MNDLCVESIRQIQEQMRRGEEEWNAKVKRGDGYVLSGGNVAPISYDDIRSGNQVIIKNYLAQNETIQRTWRERLFSWPWRPFERFQTVAGKPVFYRDNDGNLYTCPRGAEMLRNMGRIA